MKCPDCGEKLTADSYGSSGHEWVKYSCPCGYTHETEPKPYKHSGEPEALEDR